MNGNRSASRRLAGRIFACAALGVVAALAAEPPTKTEAKPATPPVSQFAPAELLAAEVDDLRAAARRDLADEQAFHKVGDARNGDAAALATLLLVLGLHDQPNKYRALAAEALPAAVAMSTTHKYPAAREAGARLEQSLARRPTTTDEPKDPPGQSTLKWSAPATSEPLLYFVESRYHQLEKDLADASFAKQRERSARAAAVLAALGAAMEHELEYTESPEKQAVWERESRIWRESAGKLSLAIRGNDRPAALAQFERLSQSCTNCHETFQVDQ